MSEIKLRNRLYLRISCRFSLRPQGTSADQQMVGTGEPPGRCLKANTEKTGHQGGLPVSCSETLLTEVAPYYRLLGQLPMSQPAAHFVGNHALCTEEEKPELLMMQSNS